MAYGTPVIAYAGRWLPTVVEDGETELFEPEIGSVSGLVRVPQWMWQHAAERQQMDVAGGQRVNKRVTDTLMACRHAEFYQELLSADKTHF
jgi:hypothetical protein